MIFSELSIEGRLRRLAILLFLFCFLTGTLIVFILNAYEADSDRQRAQIVASRYAQKIQERLQNAMSATFALAAVVRQGNGEVSDFNGLASQMIRLYPGVSALQLLPNGIIRQVYPLKGNEKAIGHNVLTDKLRNKEALIALKTRQLALAGPFPLIQGGVAIIGRFPIYLTQNGEDVFWGFTNALVQIKDLLDAARLQEIEEQEGFQYQLWRINPDTRKTHIFAGEKQPLRDPVSASFQVPNGEWTLSIQPLGGWHAKSSNIPGVFFVFLGSFVLAYAYYRALLKSTQLRREIESAHKEWMDAFDSVRVQVFLHDNEFKIMRANKAYLETAQCSLEYAIGKPYWHVFPKQGGPFPGCSQLVEASHRGSIDEEITLEDGRVFISHACRVDSDPPYSIHLLEDITERQALFKEAQYQAYHDVLTGLPNRALLQERFQQAFAMAKRNHWKMAVLLLDLDRFKPVNDVYGHAIGDILLKKVSHRLISCLEQETDTIARLGGDEFVALLSEVESPEQVERIAQKMVNQLSLAFDLALETPVAISVSIGVALYPEHGTTLETLLQAADSAMYEMKAAGRNGYVLAENNASSCILKSFKP